MFQLVIQLGNIEVRNGEYLSRQEAQGDLHVDWNADDNALYALIISNPKSGEIIGEYLNIRGNQIQPNNTVIPYNITPYLDLDSDSEIQIDLYGQDDYVEPFDVLLDQLIPLASFTFWIDPPAQGRYQADAGISNQQKKYCDCIIEDAAKQPESCLIEQAWYQKRDGYTCSNPYAICGRLPHDNNECFLHYDYDQLSKAELRALAILQKMSLPQNISRSELIQRFEDKRNSKGMR